jgi:hypothetical protein
MYFALLHPLDAVAREIGAGEELLDCTAYYRRSFNLLRRIFKPLWMRD